MGGSGVWDVDLIARGHVEGSNNFGYGFSKTYMWNASSGIAQKGTKWEAIRKVSGLQSEVRVQRRNGRCDTLFSVGLRSKRCAAMLNILKVWVRLSFKNVSQSSEWGTGSHEAKLDSDRQKITSFKNPLCFQSQWVQGDKSSCRSQRWAVEASGIQGQGWALECPQLYSYTSSWIIVREGVSLLQLWRGTVGLCLGPCMPLYDQHCSCMFCALFRVFSLSLRESLSQVAGQAHRPHWCSKAPSLIRLSGGLLARAPCLASPLLHCPSRKNFCNVTLAQGWFLYVLLLGKRKLG